MSLDLQVSGPWRPKSRVANPVVTRVVKFRSRSSVGKSWEFESVNSDGVKAHTLKILANWHKRQVTFATLSHRLRNFTSLF
jgi:hypothetical protein